MKHRALVSGLSLASFLFTCCFASVQSANAWTLSFEFGQAQNQWAYFQYGQMGKNGFFGEYNIDNSTTPGVYADLNGWVGNGPDVNQLVSGSNATIGHTSLTVNPGLGNEWLKLSGRYNINLYQTGSTLGSFVAMSPGTLTMWSLLVDLPIFRMTYGKKIFDKGLGLQFGQTRSEEYLVLARDVCVPDILALLVGRGVLPRGVLSFFNPLAWGRYGSELKDDEQDPTPSDASWPKVRGSFGGAAINCATLTLGCGVLPWQTLTTAFATTPLTFPITPYNINDVSAGVAQNWIAYLLYTSTDLMIGIGTTRTTLHAGPELVPPDTVVLGDPTFIRRHTPTQEVYVTEGWAYFVYNNRRFFGSAEVDWFNRILRFQKTADGFVWNGSLPLLPPFDPVTGVSPFASKYIDSWRFFAEAGVIFGPTSMKAMFSYFPGQDRRHGIIIDRQPFMQFQEQQATQVLDPYCLHLNYLFAGGVNAPQHLNAAVAVGAKVDHMLASNLIVFGSLFKAWRNAHGYGMGFVRPAVSGIDTTGFGTVNYTPRGSYTVPAPAIPDNDLGWEAAAGLTWQLAEGCFIDARFSYWQPGKWFNYACIDRAVPGWDNPNPLNNWGVNVDRKIDPFYGIEFRMAASY